MLRYLLACFAALLAACAYVNGPCELTIGGEDGARAVCEHGGSMLLIPPGILRSPPPPQKGEAPGRTMDIRRGLLAEGTPPREA